MRILSRLSVLLLLLPLGSFAAPVPGLDWLRVITDNTDQLVTANTDSLAFFGQWELGVFVCIGILGVYLAHARLILSSGHHHPLIIGDLLAFLVKAMFFSVTMTYYATPFPGTTLSLHQIPAFFSEQIASSLQSQVVGQVFQQITIACQNLGKPHGLTDIVGAIMYVGVLLDMGFLAVGMFVVDAFSFVMVGVLSLFGYILIPFGLTKRLERWCWDWLGQYVAFCMMRAVAQGVLTIYAGTFFTFFTKTLNGDYSLGAWIGTLGALIPLTVAFLYSVFKIPTITSVLFGGAGAAAQGFASEVQQGVVALLTR